MAAGRWASSWRLAFAAWLVVPQAIVGNDQNENPVRDCSGNCALGVPISCSSGIVNCDNREVVDGAAVNGWEESPHGNVDTCSQSVWIDLDLREPLRFDRVVLYARLSSGQSRTYCGRKVEIKEEKDGQSLDWKIIYDKGAEYSPPQTKDGTIMEGFGTRVARYLRVHSSRSNLENVASFIGVEVFCDSCTQDCDWQCYLDRYPSLQKKVGAHNVAAAEAYFLDTGLVEGQDCTCTNFDCHWDCYLARYPELRNDLIDVSDRSLKRHYQNYGKDEGKDCTCPVGFTHMPMVTHTTTTTTTKMTSTSTTTTTKISSTSTTTTSTTTKMTSTSTTTTTTIPSTTTTTLTERTTTTLSSRPASKHMVLGSFGITVANAHAFAEAVDYIAMKFALKEAIVDVVPSATADMVSIDAVTVSGRRLWGANRNSPIDRWWDNMVSNVKETVTKVKTSVKEVWHKVVRKIAPTSKLAQSHPEVVAVTTKPTAAPGVAPLQAAASARPTSAAAAETGPALATEYQPTGMHAKVDIFFTVDSPSLSSSAQVTADLDKDYADLERVHRFICARLNDAGMPSETSGCRRSLSALFDARIAEVATGTSYSGAPMLLFIVCGIALVAVTVAFRSRQNHCSYGIKVGPYSSFNHANIRPYDGSGDDDNYSEGSAASLLAGDRSSPYRSMVHTETVLLGESSDGVEF